MSKKEEEKRIVKVRYAFERMDSYEIATGVFSIVGILLILAISLPNIFTLKPINTLMPILIAVSFFTGFAMIIFFSLRTKRLAEGKKAKEIIENGDEVIGVIKNMSVTDLKDAQCFNYDVEYEDPQKHTHRSTSITTPAVLKDTMFVGEEDLPLEAVFYVYRKHTHLYALINPPVSEMKKRKTVFYLKVAYPYIIFVLSIVIAAILSIRGEYELCLGIGFGGVAISLIILSIRYRDIFKK
jgi:small-conductance mechanosensitive channel